MSLYHFPALDGSIPFQQGKLSGLITAQGKDLLPDSFTAEELNMMLKNGISLKDSPTTTAALVKLPGSGTTVFLKRNNNKGIRFTCRYLFRCARVFHAAKVANVFEKLNIRTPRVYMAAEHKSGLYLHAGYIMTEVIPDVKSIQLLLEKNENKEEILKYFLPWAAEKMTVLHRSGITHGDLKLVNAYCDGDWHEPEQSFGMWDLDSVKIRTTPRPLEVDREISRLFFSLGLIPDEQGKRWQNTEKDVRDFCKLYQTFAPEIYQPDPAGIMNFINKRIARLRKKPYPGMIKGTF